jgi:hypothetical protein
VILDDLSDDRNPTRHRQAALAGRGEHLAASNRRTGAGTLHPDGKRFARLKGTPSPERLHVSLMLSAACAARCRRRTG